LRPEGKRKTAPPPGFIPVMGRLFVGRADRI
jgi:hypothetical protein